MTPADRSMRARIAAHERWAKEPDYTAATAPARAGLSRRFVADVEASAAAQGIVLTEDQLTERVEHLRKAHYLRMAQRSIAVRRENKRQKLALA
jgi:hypothetical protein